jgi:hypothetical protein
MYIEEKNYDGSLIHERFAYRFLKKNIKATGDIVSFVGPMMVSTNLIDLEDSMSNDYIVSQGAMNFCWEIPNLDAFGAVCFQRLFNTKIASILYKYISKSISVRGDDIMVYDNFIGSDGTEQDKGKASVSITYSKDNVAIGHTGINIVAGPLAPNFAYSTNLPIEKCLEFMAEVETEFYNMTQDIFVATAKVIV